MLSEIIDFESWTAPSTVSLAQSITKKKEVSNDKRSAISWKHFKDELSPLSLYIYLKARFGKPNGIAMIGWQPRIKNIIHWHYTIHCHSSTINFWGHSSGLEIMIASPENLENGDRETFITALKNDFSKHGKEMGEIKKQLDQWSIFINPFVRLNQTLHHLTDELEDIDLSEPRALPPDHTDQDLRSFLDDTKVWIKNTTKAAALGTAIRMLFPVVVESFINLFIYIFRKQELKVDPRLYENQIRQQIDIRAKSLHMTCDGLTSPIDGNDPRFKAFHTLMNGRNDFLHGNIDPVRMQLEDIYFDATFIPIYKEDDGIIKKMIPKYLAHVSLAEVQKDERVVNDFMDMVFEKLEESSFQTFYELFSERFPGINKNTQEIRPVVSDDFAEGYATFSRKAEDDPSYQLFLNDETTFELYIPATWQHFREENRHYFHPYERHNPENLIVSVLNNQEGRSFIDSRIKGREEKKMGKKKFYLLASPKDLHVNSYFHFSENDTQFALFTYTYPERLDPDLESRSLDQMIADAEKIIESFEFVGSSKRDERVFFAKYSSFIRGIASCQLLFNKAFDNKAFFEAIIIIKNQIDGLLRISIVMHDQIINNTDAVDLRWIYQDETQPAIPFQTILAECLKRDIIDTKLLKILTDVNDRQVFLINNFVVSPVNLTVIGHLATELYKISETIGQKVFALEKQQVEQGVGIGKKMKSGNEAFFRDFIKAKLGKTKP